MEDKNFMKYESLAINYNDYSGSKSFLRALLFGYCF